MNNKVLFLSFVLILFLIIFVSIYYKINTNKMNHKNSIIFSYIINGKTVSENEFNLLKNKLEISKDVLYSAPIVSPPINNGSYPNGTETAYEAIHKVTRQKYQYVKIAYPNKEILEITVIQDSEENPNFILYISNQSFALNPVDIKVSIDKRVVVDQDFFVEDQHNWQEFKFSIPKGNHNIVIASLKGNAILEKEFEIKDKHWAAIDYSYYPESNHPSDLKQFLFFIQNEPIHFE